MNRNEQRAAETKKNLQEAFLKLYEKKEISQITIREITDLAGYNQSTESKLWQRDYIMEYHFSATLTILRRWIQNGQKESLEELLDFLLQISFQDPSLCYFNDFIRSSPRPADKTVHGYCSTKAACHEPSAAAWSADPTPDTADAAPCCPPSKAPRT